MKNMFTKLAAVYSMLLLCSHANAQDLVWAKQNTGISIFEEGRAIAVDAAGNVYTAGVFGDSADLDPGVNEYKLYSNGGEDIYVQKLDASGNFAWAFSIGSITPDGVHDIYLDAAGDVYITGQMTGTIDFDPGVGTDAQTTVGSDDIFFAKYTSAGVYVFAKHMGSTAGDGGRSITCDTAGNIYITGYFRTQADLDPDAGTTTLVSAGSGDIFIAKYSPLGSFIWANGIGGSNGDIGQSITIDDMGNVLVSGNFYGTTVDFDPGGGTTNLSTNGFSDIFVASFTSGGAFNWAHGIGGLVNDDGSSIVTDDTGNVFVTGYFQGTGVDFDPGAGTTTLTATAEDIYILKLDASGNFSWVKQIGGVNPDAAYGLDIDAAGNLYLTGYFTSIVDFDPGTGIVNLTGLGVDDAFVAKYDAAGALIWARSMGSTASDNAKAICADVSGNVYTTGYFNGTVDFDPGVGILTFVSASKDAYVQKLSAVSGIQSIVIPVNLSLYPNPATGELNISFGKQDVIKVSLIDMMGQQLQQIDVSNRSSVQIDISSLPTGTYFLEARGEQGTNIIKWCKE